MRARSAWIWSAPVDVAVFGGSAAFALLLAALSPLLAAEGGALPFWGFVVFVVAVDVAHVHTTLFRTYLDGDELRRRKALYLGIPLGCYAVGVALHAVSAMTFWRALAYVAVFHFVRQQIGWVAIYRARAGEGSRLDRLLDEATIYAATGFPLLYWHAHLPRSFSWFMQGDFASSASLAPLVAPFGALYAAIALAYVARAVTQALRGRMNLGKHLVVATTAVTWLVGIVVTNSDFQFTVTNVIVHGVPYFALLWAYSRQRAREAPKTLSSQVASRGVLAFLGVALAFAFFEELGWDRLVWHDHPQLFGGDPDAAPLLGPLATSLVVPLLAVPQATHYVLDAVLWRRKDAGSAQARALGFGVSPRPRSGPLAAPPRTL